MQEKDMHNLEKADLLAIIEKQQKEINSLKNSVNDLEKKLNQKEADFITDVSLKIGNVLEDAKQYLNKIKEAHSEITEVLKTVKSADKSDLEESAEHITNEEKLKDTNAKTEVDIKKEEVNSSDKILEEKKCEETNEQKTDSNREVNFILIDTKEESQINKIEKSNMLIPIFNDLAIIEPIYIKKKNLILILIYFIASIIIVFSVTSCFKVYKQDNTTISLTQNLQNYINDNNTIVKDTKKDSSTYSVNFDELKNINSDTCGWIKLNGIDINMPVVQTDNNDYYLKYSFDKTYNLSGWAFVDYRDKLDGTDKNIVIYGHNRRDNIMFSPLIKILEPSWYDNDDNKYVTFITENGEEYTYEVCSIYQIEVEDYYTQTSFANEKEYQKFLNTIKSRSIKNYDINLDTNDQILTLSTCGNNSKYRVILHAKKI